MLGEGPILDLTGRDRAVQLEQPAVGLVGVVGDASRPAVRGGDGLVELAVEVAEIDPRTVVQLVVELRQADLALGADLGAAGDQAASDVGDFVAVLAWPGEGSECNWEFSETFGADAEASHSCRVRFIRG